MRVLITGAAGQLGRTLTHVIAQQYDVIAMDREALDIADLLQVEKIIQDKKPSFVINAAAYTAVDKAENDRTQAMLINQHGPENLAKVCNVNNIPIIHISTDYVFNGEKKIPYTEADTPEPINVYGESKWLGEEAVRTHAKKSIILRVSWVFGVYGNNFVKTIQRLSRERETLNIVNDQYGCPTSTENISKVLLQIVTIMTSPNFDGYGTYHYCDSSATNWYDFANIIVKETQQYETLAIKEIKPIPSKDFPTPAKRQTNSQMNCSKLKETFGIDQYAWKDALHTMIKEQNIS